MKASHYFASAATFSEFHAHCCERTDAQIKQHLAAYQGHQPLVDAMSYSLLNGGKRIRPVLVYASARAVGDIREASDLAAVAIEAIHAYSLVHDDLPAMDDDDLRRGKPTCHIAFDEATAILAGDALQTMAFEVLCNPCSLEPSIQRLMLQTLASASGANGMVAGQSIDLASIKQSLNLTQLENMHRLKTGALIRAAIRLGALSSGQAPSELQLQNLDDYAQAIGLAFQVQDDILDVTADTQTLGKQQGADAALQKPTYVSLLGLDSAKNKAAELHEQAIEALASFDSNADHLRELAHYIIHRTY